MAPWGAAGALSAPRRLGCLLAAAGVVLVMAVDLTFVAAGIGRPRATTPQLQPLWQGADAGPTVAGKSGPAAHHGPTPWLLLAPAALLAAAALRSRAAKTQQGPSFQGRSKHVRHFFGKAKETEAETAEPEELSEAAKAACAQLQEEIDELKALAQEKRDAHDRLQKEVDNFRARTRQELATARGKAAIPLVKELLPISDEFEYAKQNLKLEGDGEKAIADKFEELFNKMIDTWKQVGVQRMKSVGEDFDPELHEAISMIPSQEYKSDLVCNEMRAGWGLKPIGAEKTIVLRPSLVCVSAGPGPS